MEVAKIGKRGGGEISSQPANNLEGSSTKFTARQSRNQKQRTTTAKYAKYAERNTATEGMATKGHKDHKELRPDGPLSLALSPLSGEGRRAAREKCSQLANNLDYCSAESCILHSHK